ncbi:MAG: hypothetical protein VKK04_22985 [Synechococcales bacterium]|nr:hypothetical protein [Synechococcales bacterium]
MLTLLTLALVFAGLPALFLLLDVPSFAVGEDALWVLRWQNDAAGSSIEFNLWPLMAIALIIGLTTVLIPIWRSRKH